MTEASERIEDWVKAELAPWRERPPPQASDLHQKLRDLAATSQTIFLLSTRNYSVRLEPKPPELRPENDVVAEVVKARAEYFCKFMTLIAKVSPFPDGAIIAVDVDDHPSQYPDAPVFSFQKLADSPLLLLPDVDMLQYDFYLDEANEDKLEFSEKKDAAVFVGSTSGGIVTPEVVRTLALPRLRAASYFLSHEDVVFRIAQVVQYTVPEVVQQITDLGVTGPRMDWSDQFEYRYILSMDGNGATCSRVAIALASNSVLVKYTSDFMLFFFRGLQDGVHLFSVVDDPAVDDLLLQGRAYPDKMVAAALGGKVFARTYLTRIAVMYYTDRLLRGYISLTGVSDSSPQGDSPFLVDTIGDFEDGRRRRAIFNDWLGVQGASSTPLRSFKLELGPQIEAADVSYQGILSDGSTMAPCRAQEFCGGSDHGAGLIGVIIHLGGAAAEAYELSYELGVRDGSRSGLVGAGERCLSASGSRLVAMNVKMSKRREKIQAAVPPRRHGLMSMFKRT